MSERGEMSPGYEITLRDVPVSKEYSFGLPGIIPTAPPQKIFVKIDSDGHVYQGVLTLVMDEKRDG